MTPLEDLLRQCTVKITVPGGWGTGFFVAPGLILTCAHVVRKAVDLQVDVFYPARESPLSAIAFEIADDGKTLDLALVKLSEPLSGHPCVLLDEEPVAIAQALYSYGYLESYANAAPVRPVNEGLTGDTPPLLKLQGAQIEKGISGAALLNLKTGKVCGVVKETRAAGSDLGGGAIPTRVILEQFPELRELQREWHEQNPQWLQIIAQKTANPNASAEGDEITGDKIAGDKIAGDKIAGNKLTVNDGQGMQVNSPQAPVIQVQGDLYLGNSSSQLAQPAAIDFQPYLQSIATTYAKWWQLYTLMDAEGQQRQVQEPAPMFDFGLMVQTVQPQEKQPQEKQRGQEKVERFSVLDGLRKYATGEKPEPVLLVGRPGAGKSTALARLMLEEATTQTSEVLETSEVSADSPRIPVLVELRYWQGSLSDLIHDAIARHDPALKAVPLDGLLAKSLLLFDGVNELPSEEARSQLIAFRRNHTLPMIFTTRDLSLGGDLGIERKLELQPLTEPQMQAFIRAYIPEQAEAMLRQLKKRLREFGQTPLLLWMLCGLFQQTGTIPENLGLVFRLFTQGYERRLKQDVVIESDRDWWQPVLQQLAWVMMQGKTPTELRVAIPRDEAVGAIAQFLQGKVPYAEDFARRCLRDLQKHHLTQAGSNPNDLEFRHQLLQEYYAAEALLNQLPTLTDAQLQQDYLNYLKWTEPVALMLALVEREQQAVRVVRLALAVDWGLGARLAGEVKREFQKQAVGFVAELEAPIWLQIRLWGKTRSAVILPRLLETLKNENSNLVQEAASALEKHNDANVIPALLNTINNPCLDFYGSYKIATIIGELSSQNTDILLKALYELDDSTCLGAIRSLGEDRSDLVLKLLPVFIALLKDANCSIRRITTKALKDATELEIDSRLEALAPSLSQAINDSDLDVFINVTEALGNLGSTDTIPNLCQALKDPDELVRGRAAMGLGKLGSTSAISDLRQALKDPDELVRDCVVGALDDISRRVARNSHKQASPTQELIWQIANPFSVGGEVIDILESNTFLESVTQLLKLLEDPAKDLRRDGAEVLGNMFALKLIPDSSKLVTNSLLKLIADPDFSVRGSVAEALGKIGLPEAVPSLLRLLEDPHASVRGSAAQACGKIGSAEAIPSLLRLLEDPHASVRRSAAQACGKTGSVEAIPGLLKLLAGVDCYEDEDECSNVRRSAAEALGKFKGDRTAHILPNLLQLLPTKSGEEAIQAIQAIQANCKYYNYEISVDRKVSPTLVNKWL